MLIRGTSGWSDAVTEFGPYPCSGHHHAGSGPRSVDQGTLLDGVQPARDFCQLQLAWLRRGCRKGFFENKSKSKQNESW